MFADKFSLVRAEFFIQRVFLCRFGIIERNKTDLTAAFPRIGQNLILLFAPFADAYIVLCHAIQHIFAFADVGQFPVDRDAVDSGAFKSGRKALSLQGLIHIV